MKRMRVCACVPARVCGGAGVRVCPCVICVWVCVCGAVSVGEGVGVGKCGRMCVYGGGGGRVV